MAIEEQRACGYRKVGGLYLVSEPLVRSCDRTEIPLVPCVYCGRGIKQARAWTWFRPLHDIGRHTLPKGVALDPKKPKVLTVKDVPCECMDRRQSSDPACLLCDPPEGDHGLLWIGREYYTPSSFLSEAMQMGISRRLPKAAVPRNLDFTVHKLYFAHPDAIVETPDFSGVKAGETVEAKTVPGIIAAISLYGCRLELLAWESEATEEFVEAQDRRGITVIKIPDGDTDHAPEKGKRGEEE